MPTTKRAFTLVELLVVMGIMGALATISTGGYYAVVRGMEERGAVTSATGIIRAAQQRARVDRMPTAVYFYNELVAPETSDDYAKAQGVAVAVRQSGRLSWVSGDNYYDEFADLADIYGLADPDNPRDATQVNKSSGMRLYKFGVVNDAKGQKLDYTLVGASVVRGAVAEAETTGLVTYSTKDSDKELPMYAFVKHAKNDGAASWKTGDAYAFEFSTVRLPVGYVFGDDYPRDVNDPTKPVKVMVFEPNRTGETLEDRIEIKALRPGKGGAPELKSVGKTQTDVNSI